MLETPVADQTIISHPNTKEFSVEVKQLSLSRGNSFLFENVSFTLGPSELVWINGGNGMGKTSLLRLLAGFSRPDSGTITYQISNEACRSRDLLGFQGHQNAFKTPHTAREALTFWADIMDVKEQSLTLLNRVGLEARADVAYGQLSAGQKRRLALARLILSEKKVWVMDEPTAAIDKDGVKLIYDLIETHIRYGGSAVIASHNTAQNIAAHTRRLTLEMSS